MDPPTIAVPSNFKSEGMNTLQILVCTRRLNDDTLVFLQTAVSVSLQLGKTSTGNETEGVRGTNPGQGPQAM